MHSAGPHIPIPRTTPTESTRFRRFHLSARVAVLDSDKSRLTVINAGHLPPLLRRGGQNSLRIEELAKDVAGLPLGVHDCSYRQFETEFEPGDTLLLYTDGLNEARNSAGELYGMDRLRTAIAAAPGDPEEIVNFVLSDLQQFTQSRLAGDDVTMLCLGRTI